MNTLHVATVLTSLTLLVAIGCSGESCEEREAVGYPEMEAMAKSSLDGVEHSLQRVGACEDTGSPRTVLYATVDEWPNRRVANRYFEQHGWTRDVDGLLNSPDGAYWVNNITTRVGNDPTPFVTVQFFEHADDDSAD